MRYQEEGTEIDANVFFDSLLENRERGISDYEAFRRASADGYRAANQEEAELESKDSSGFM